MFILDTATQGTAGANNAQAAQTKPEVKPEVKQEGQPSPDINVLQTKIQQLEEQVARTPQEIQQAFLLGQQQAQQLLQQQTQQEPSLEVDPNDPLNIKSQVKQVIQQDRLINAYESSIQQYANELSQGWHPETPGVDRQKLDSFVLQQATAIADNPNFLPQLINNPRERTRQAFNYAMQQSPIKYVQIIQGQQNQAPNISSSSNGQTDYGGQSAASGGTADQIGSLQTQLQEAKAKALATPTPENRQAVFNLSAKLQDAQRKT